MEKILKFKISNFFQLFNFIVKLKNWKNWKFVNFQFPNFPIVPSEKLDNWKIGNSCVIVKDKNFIKMLKFSNFPTFQFYGKIGNLEHWKVGNFQFSNFIIGKIRKLEIPVLL